MKIDPAELTKKLISFKSITPRDNGAIEHIAAILKKSGFDCRILEFGDSETRVKNLYAKYINGVPNLCFAGHIDVVPPGQLKDWQSDPFKPEVRNGMLYGRGATDMKSGVAAFITAMVNLIEEKFQFNGSISALITSSEESMEEYGTKAVLEWMESKQKKIDYCIVAEPTSSEKLGDTIKIGRRGSATFKLVCYGRQGHVAYPDLADNPIYKMMSILNKVKNTTFDHGNRYFQPSNCEITTIDVGNDTDNLIPGSVTASFNIRYNNMQTPGGLYKLIDEICSSVTNDYKLSMYSSRDAFLSTPDRDTDIMLDAINKVTNIDAVLSTSGGTSDAAFIKDVCPVIEFGMINKTTHQVNECVSVDDIHKLTAIYKEFIKNYFYPTNKILNQINVIGNIPDGPLLA
ncbi:succinyl-diaminopimelate desuccinylase [Wolbachia endosymbiont of Cimex lectularius]|uniref:succinyl-diaminopimelate desuccinylase n=1 Tax=Wolbachia endosymbiont of Cimex lectularius TaxID=246273 RepID=UPI000499ED30|nr:succinyl-diaminopimelate desuccinylase [Wolbachia endosymbiont of Cimex lectularius]BAO99422.1 succinyl-diaminopimelate desuccinylase [Wolbachia endosymbiont of Cimex lectularius]